jgi:hypothetical protein
MLTAIFEGATVIEPELASLIATTEAQPLLFE